MLQHHAKSGGGKKKSKGKIKFSTLFFAFWSFQSTYLVYWSIVIYLISDFKCSTCQKAYSSKTTLAAHEKTHQAIDPNKCKFCKIEFKKQSAYEKHMETEHPLYV